MKRLLVFAMLGLILGAGAAAGILWSAYTSAEDIPAGRIDVTRGMSMHAVAAELHQRGLLRHRQVFLLAARLTGRDVDLRVGTFAIAAGSSPREILLTLTEDAPVPVVVTLPEGMAAVDMAAVVGDSLGLEAASILAAADALVRAGAETLMTDAERRTMFELVAGQRPDGSALHLCEGYLAPDTYHFTLGLDADQVARTMVGLQLQRVDEARTTALSTHGLLALAALVEAETRLAHERRLVSAVYNNRLLQGMRMEADPTVAFWLGKRGQRLLYRDLEVDSPYNTYRRAGLPAGPVLAPGREAVLAAADPDPTCEAVFFVADGEGGHVFSETKAEHDRAVARYRELMRQRRR